MHRVKIFLSSSLFSFYQGMVRTMKMSFFRKKNILSRYTQILVEFPRLMASSSEWTRLKPLLRESSLLTSGFTRIIVYIKADRTLTRFRCGKKWENMEWNGIKRSRGPFSLVPRLPLNSLGSPMFFFFSFEFSPNCGARSHAKLIAVQDFVFSKWFCTDIILYFKNPLPLPLPTLTHNVSITNKNKQRSCTSRRVCNIPARIIQLYKDIHYFQFDFPCFLLFIYCLAVCLSSFKWNCQR